jgi:hypothetical protein
MFRLEGFIIRLFVELYLRHIKYSEHFVIPKVTFWDTKMCTVLDVSKFAEPYGRYIKYSVHLGSQK